MKFALNALILKKQNTGTGMYTKLLVQELVKNTEHEWYVFVPDESVLPIAAGHVHVIVLPLAAKGGLYRVFAEQFLLPWYIKKINPDILHSTSFVIPFAVRRTLQIVTVHDMFHEVCKSSIRPVKRFYYSLFFNRSIRRADGVIAVSQNTRADISEVLHIPPEKIAVTYPGVNPAFTEFVETDETREKIEKLCLPEKYVLFVGSLEPRKNLGKLIDAFSVLGDGCGVKLVITGIPVWKTGILADKITASGLLDIVIFTGYVDEDILPRLYKNALALILPSLYEGFGFPVIESMYMGTPVIISDNSSLREIAGKAAFFVEPLDHHSIAKAIQKLLSDTLLRNNLHEAGIEEVKKYTWHQTALKTILYYSKIIEESR